MILGETNMDIKINGQKENMTVWPERLYTQHEVDDLLEEKEESLTFQARGIEERTQTADEHKSLDKNLVAGLVRKSNRILVSISSRFPFELFPDTINVEEGRVTVITRSSPFSSRVHSVDIKDISNVFINTAPFFAQLVIVSKTFTENEIGIKTLRKGEAVFARRIIEGLRIFANKQIDTSSYTRVELIAKLEELSRIGIMT